MEHVFFPFDAELKNELDQIKLAIQGEQNGIGSRSMGAMAYKKNYGVPYPSLRRIAANYQPDAKLANCLWNIGYRETMLLALLLFPKDAMAESDVQRLTAEMKEMELAEFACRDLFCLLPGAENYVQGLLAQGADFSLEVAYLLAARLLERSDRPLTFVTVLTDRVEADLLLGKASLAKAISNFLKQLGLFNKHTAQVMAVVDHLSKSDNMQLRWVAEEVRTEVEYSNHKD